MSKKLSDAVAGNTVESVTTGTAAVAADLFLRLTNAEDEIFGKFVCVAKRIERRYGEIDPQLQ